jgi:predicted Zn finger-like uncharacterized protein
MYSRCPSCETVYQLEAANLAEAAGVVRCGHCGKTFNALSHLFHGHPAPDQPSIKGSGVPPLLDQATITQTELPGVSLQAPDTTEPGPMLDFDFGQAGPMPGWKSRAWMLASLSLAVLLMVQLVLQWNDPQSRLANWSSGDSAWQQQMDAAGLIQLISRDMHRHPSLDDAIVISATVRNPSEHTLAWPVLEVRLYDASQQVLGARQLTPTDYLLSDTMRERGMAPELVVPVILEFVVGTTEPSGFDLRFL